MNRTLTGLSVIGLLTSSIFGQSTVKPPVFENADVHVSAHSINPVISGGGLRGDHYVLRSATMVDLIAAAYGVETDKVLGGPSWLEMDRFDVIAKTLPSTSPETVRLMLQALLADRFKLVVHTDSKPVSVFALTVGNGKPKLTEAESTGDSGCQRQPSNAVPGATPVIVFSCRNMTMEAFAQNLRGVAAAYLTSPVMDSTGLKGRWNFDLRWTPRGALAQAGAEGISIFDAVDKQLGLKLDMLKIANPVIVVDGVNEKPTDNPPGVTASLLPPPPAQFEVAVIKPSLPGAKEGGGIDPSGKVNLQGATLQMLITLAWDLNPNDNDALIGAPKWLDSTRYDIVAKISTDGSSIASQVDFDTVLKMLRALLEDRFKLRVHTEERPATAYTLVAVSPKLRKADASNRTGCKSGPGPDGKDPRIANPVLNRLVTCQNITMSQFAAQLQTIAIGYIYSPVLDATGIDGAWDFTLSFSGSTQLHVGEGRGGDPAQVAGGTPTTSDPNGAISLFDAVNKQLGLKLEQHRRPVTVLVIDHVEEKPTGN